MQESPDTPSDSVAQSCPAAQTTLDAHTVYLQYQEVFRHVLRATGPWPLDDGMDVVHDFILDRLPKALKSFSPGAGQLAPWLWTVFANYAKRRRKQLAALRKHVVSLEAIHATENTTDFPEARSDALANGPRSLSLGGPRFGEHDLATLDVPVRAALKNLSAEDQELLSIYFGVGHAKDKKVAGSIRAVARRFNWSRYHAHRALLLSLAELVSFLERDGAAELLTPTELRLAHALLTRGGLDEPTMEIGRQFDVQGDDMETVLKVTLAAIGGSLTRVFSPFSHPPGPGGAQTGE